MKVGSLVECIILSQGFCYVNGLKRQVNRDIQVKEVLTVKEVRNFGNYADLLFDEIDHAIHPVLNTRCGYWVNHFREIQPPMSIDMSIFEPQPKNNFIVSK